MKKISNRKVTYNKCTSKKVPKLVYGIDKMNTGDEIGINNIDIGEDNIGANATDGFRQPFDTKSLWSSNKALSGATALGAMIATPLVEGSRTEEGKINKWAKAGEGALQGAAAGSAFGPIGAAVGAVGMGTVNYIMQDKQNKEIDKENKAIAEQKQHRLDEMIKLDRESRLSDYDFKGSNTQLVAMGGKLKNLVKYENGGVDTITPFDKKLKSRDSLYKTNITTTLKQPYKEKYVSSINEEPSTIMDFISRNITTPASKAVPGAIDILANVIPTDAILQKIDNPKSSLSANYIDNLKKAWDRYGASEEEVKAGAKPLGMIANVGNTALNFLPYNRLISGAKTAVAERLGQASDYAGSKLSSIGKTVSGKAKDVGKTAKTLYRGEETVLDKNLRLNKQYKTRIETSKSKIPEYKSSITSTGNVPATITKESNVVYKPDYIITGKQKMLPSGNTIEDYGKYFYDNKMGTSATEFKQWYNTAKDSKIISNSVAKYVGKLALGGTIDGIKNTSNIKPVASNAMKVVGNTHAEGGEIVRDNNNQPVAEVENQEIIRQNPQTNETEVDSAKLGTAQITEPLLKEKGELEQRIAPAIQLIQSLSQTMSRVGDIFQKNTIKRQVDKLTAEIQPYVQRIQEIDAQVEQVFQQQEQYKQQAGIPQQETTQSFGGVIYAKNGGTIQNKKKTPPYFIKGMKEGESRNRNINSPDGKYRGSLQVDTLNLMRYGIPKEQWDVDSINSRIGVEMLDSLWNKKNGNEREVIRGYRGNPSEKQIDSRMKFINRERPKYLWSIPDTTNITNTKLLTPYCRGGKVKKMSDGGDPFNYYAPKRNTNIFQDINYEELENQRNKYSPMELPSNIMTHHAPNLGYFHRNLPMSNTSTTSIVPTSNTTNKTNNYNWDKFGNTALTAGMTLAPFIDNWVNMRNLNKANPRPTAPRLYQPTNYETNVNISPQLSDIKSSERIANINADRTSENSIMAGQIKALNRANSLNQIGQVLSYKESKEREGRNLNARERGMIANKNIDLQNQYDAIINNWKAGKFQDISKNMANLSGDVTSIINNINTKRYQDKQLDIEALRPLSGVQSYGAGLMNMDITGWENIYKKYRGTPDGEAIKRRMKAAHYTDKDIDDMVKRVG